MSGCLITFASTQDGIAVRRALRGHCEFTVLPTPRTITASCGIAVLVSADALETVRGVLQSLGLGTERAVLYRASGDSGCECFEPMAE